MSNTIKAHIALFTVALIYGANYTIAKEVINNNYIQPSGLILLRVISGLILFSIFHQIFIKEKVERKDFKLLLICSICGVAINQLFFFNGLKLSTPIHASLIMTTTPILVLIISSILIKEKITSRKILGILLGACGAILLIAYGEKIALDKDLLLGDMMILINAFSYGIYLAFVKQLMEKYHPITVIKWIFILGFIFVLPFGYKELAVVEWQSFPTSIWLAVFYILIAVTFLTYLFNAFALKTVTPSIVSSYIYLQPLFATAIALLFEKDTLSNTKIISALLIFIGVYLVSSNKKQKKDSKNVTN